LGVKTQKYIVLTPEIRIIANKISDKYEEPTGSFFFNDSSPKKHRTSSIQQRRRRPQQPAVSAPVLSVVERVEPAKISS
jgi:hypothetical protein